MAKESTWMVRAGEEGYLAENFRVGSYVAIGWNALGDLTPVTTQEQVRDLYLKKHPGEKPFKANLAIGMIHKFRSVLVAGQKVTTYNPDTREYLVGVVQGDYQYRPDQPYHHVRPVTWSRVVSRDGLSPKSRNSLGGVMTLYRVAEEAADDLAGLSQSGGTWGDAEAEEEVELEQLKDDTVGRAHELIKDKILKLDEEELEQLVATLLRAMGYKARVSPKGPDRGVDVFASPDGLGLEEPRIKAEVKHRPKTHMGAPDIRSFLGGLRQGDRGLYVSTGGFSKDAGYEADRATVPVTLVALDDLATLVVTHYDNFDAEGRSLIRLTRLYWPVD